MSYRNISIFVMVSFRYSLLLTHDDNKGYVAPRIPSTDMLFIKSRLFVFKIDLFYTNSK